MDIFVRNVPQHATNRQLEAFLRGHLAQFGIDVFHVEKTSAKSFANITVIDVLRGQQFIDHWMQNRSAGQPSPPSLLLDKKRLLLSRSRNEPNHLSVRALAHDASRTKNKTDEKRRPTAQFQTSRVSCGMWDYAGRNLVFAKHYGSSMPGHIVIGRKSATVALEFPDCWVKIHINYHHCDNIVLGNFEDPNITFTLDRAPRLYQIKKIQEEEILEALTLGKKIKEPDAVRVLGLDSRHKEVAGTCLTYRIQLTTAINITTVKTLLSNPDMPSPVTLPTQIYKPTESLQASWARLNNELTSVGKFGSHPFGLRWQLHRLASNSILHPLKVLGLIPTVRSIYADFGMDATLSGIRQFSRQLPLAGPGTHPDDYSMTALCQLLETCASNYDKFSSGNPYELTKRHIHINLIHRVTITPTGTYLEGPDPEPTNRVLRKYAKDSDSFIRVVFEDEDGTQVGHQPRVDQSIVYDVRFKGVLDGNILIAGQGFTFLGFSHSSLRSQTCWFMAPMFNEGRLVYPPQVLKELGDFSHIRSPARCAARIGQNFTDTNATVRLEPGEVGELPMVLSGQYDFSDVVGTISEQLLRAVWRKYGTKRLLKPTALQIRFQGAKGMVSLDERLTGKKLMLRSNMKKFETATSWDLEICGAGFRPLQMVLNRQFIKLFEDLGVDTDAFMELQKTAIDELQTMTKSPTTASKFLKENSNMKATRVPDLLTSLDDIGLDYQQDEFLYSVVEMTVVSKLREIKYRGRIPVDEAIVLYGIMDETGFLQEGQVHIVTETPPVGGRQVIIKKRVVITRSPALHPGDIQIVEAVDVPDDSPLQRLRNVVIFSQHGSRDLPSQLSGGDLDGDIYNIIWDERLFPKKTCTAAEYPRVSPVELDCPVTASHMSDFFVSFMKQDVLGRICNIHMQLSDLATTFHPDCIKLAGLASTAVDFSKTGIAVDPNEIPNHDRIKPDFMAPSPRVVISERGYVECQEEDDKNEDRSIQIFETEPRPYRYYRSEQALGFLYRAIDETKFIENMQRQQREAACRLMPNASTGLMDRLFLYMQKHADRYGILYAQHEELARDIKKGYEENLIETLFTFGQTGHEPLTEPEVLAGEILGRQSGAQGKVLRERSQAMRDRFENVIEYTVVRIIKGDEAMYQTETLSDLYDEREQEALPRALACLAIAMKEPGRQDRELGEIKSFKYIVAAVCLSELARYRTTTFGESNRPLPPVSLLRV